MYQGKSKYVDHISVTGGWPPSSPRQRYPHPNPFHPLPNAEKGFFPMRVYIGAEAKVLAAPWWDDGKKRPLSGSGVWLTEEERQERRRERVFARRDLRVYGAPEWLARGEEEEEEEK